MANDRTCKYSIRNAVEDGEDVIMCPQQISSLLNNYKAPLVDKVLKEHLYDGKPLKCMEKYPCRISNQDNCVVCKACEVIEKTLNPELESVKKMRGDESWIRKKEIVKEYCKDVREKEQKERDEADYKLQKWKDKNHIADN
jgi:hypothetical protein